MASPDVLDFARLLAPIPGANPAGVDLREDVSPTSMYYKIKGARTAARDIERKAVMDYDQAQAAKPDWSPVMKLGPDVLAKTSKDLEVVSWMIEALVRAHGFTGLRDGFRLTRELCEQYWDGIYPLPEKDDPFGMETRVFPLTGLNGADAEGTLIAPILRVSITKSGYSSTQYKASVDIDRLDLAKKEQRIAEGGISLDAFEKTVRESGADYYKTLLADLEQCIDEFFKLNELLEAKCSSMAPPSSNIRNALVEVRDTVQSISRVLLDTAGAAAAAVAAAMAAGDKHALVVTGGGGVQAGNSGPIASRDDALRVLLQVAEFFRRTEPHNPVSYAVEQAVRWGRMPLPELLGELIADQGSRDQMFKLVGIRPTEGNTSG